jgi:predicted ribosomally synthesized peptide with SipW-like signal peptide
MENKKSLIALALVALVGIVGGTYAYFTSSAKLTNEFKTGTYSTSVTEEFVSPDNWTPGTTTTKKVNVTNNGSVEVAVRASYTEIWTAKDGTVLSGTRNGERVAQFTIGSDWELASDGYYYYKETLKNGQTSSDFISSVTFNPNFELEEGTDIQCTTTKENGKTTVNCANLTTGYAGATYSLDITIETIQADKKWSYTAVKKL